MILTLPLFRPPLCSRNTKGRALSRLAPDPSSNGLSFAPRHVIKTDPQRLVWKSGPKCGKGSRVTP